MTKRLEAQNSARLMYLKPFNKDESLLRLVPNSRGYRHILVPLSQKIELRHYVWGALYYEGLG